MERTCETTSGLFSLSLIEIGLQSAFLVDKTTEKLHFGLKIHNFVIISKILIQ